MHFFAFNFWNIIHCNDLYCSLDESGRINSNVIDDYANIYDKHPLTKKRYIGWDVAFTEHGPLIVEGNEYPGCGLLQFYKLKGKKTGHLKDIADVLQDEMNNIKL